MSEHHLKENATHLAEELVHETEEEVGQTAALLTADEQPSMLDAMGGPLGAAESALPSVAFVVASTAGLPTTSSAIIAVAIAVVAGVARLMRRETVQFALAGIVGVALSAFLASKTGEARNFFLPGLIANSAYAAITLGSVAVRWPFVGVMVAGLTGHEGWRADPVRMRAYRNATLIFATIFLLRLIVQVPLWIADATTTLGIARTVMGLPLFGFGIWLSWLLLRDLDTGKQADAPAA
ncbi:MAG: DUF3159 domain-containing protein [Patulibacter sp.]